MLCPVGDTLLSQQLREHTLHAQARGGQGWTVRLLPYYENSEVSGRMLLLQRTGRAVSNLLAMPPQDAASTDSPLLDTLRTLRGINLFEYEDGRIEIHGDVRLLTGYDPDLFTESKLRWTAMLGEDDQARRRDLLAQVRQEGALEQDLST